MTYSLINKCAKNYYNRTFIVPVIAKNVVTCFFLRHSVYHFCVIYKYKKSELMLMIPARGKRCAACKGLSNFAHVCIKSGNAVRVKDTREGTVFHRGQGLVRAVTVDNEPDFHNRGTGCQEPEVEDEFDLSQYGACTDWITNRIHAINVRSQSAVLEVEINGMAIEMVYDPGAALTIFPLKLWQDLGKPDVTPVPTLQAYTHISVATKGWVTVDVTAFDQQKQLSAIVVDMDDVCLLG